MVKEEVALYLSLLFQVFSMPFNPFRWDKTSKMVHSDVLTMELKDNKSNTVKVSELSSDVLVKLPLKEAGSPTKSQTFFVKSGTSRFHVIKSDFGNVSIQLEITPKDASVNLSFFMRYGHRPTNKEHDLNGTLFGNEWCIWTRMQGENKRKRVCSSNRPAPIHIYAEKPGKYHIEVRNDKSLMKRKYRQKRSCFGHGRERRSCVEVKDPPPTPPNGKYVTVVPVYDPNTDHNYTMRVSLGSCVYWSKERQMWTTEGCQVRSTEKM